MKRSWTHWARAAAVGVVSLTMVAACSGRSTTDSGGKDGQVTLKINFWGDFGLQDLKTRYEADHPNVKIQLNSGEYNAQHEDLQKKLVAGSGAADIAAGQTAVKTVQVTDEVAGYIVDIARATRESPSLSLGVSPRGATALLRSARAWAWLTGRDFVTPDDVKALAHATLVHRLGLRPEAELEGVDVAEVLGSALNSVPVPR